MAGGPGGDDISEVPGTRRRQRQEVTAGRGAARRCGPGAASARLHRPGRVLAGRTTRDGEQRVGRRQERLTVVEPTSASATRDQDFDLQSLVGVIERRYEDDWR